MAEILCRELLIGAGALGLGCTVMTAMALRLPASVMLLESLKSVLRGRLC